MLVQTPPISFTPRHVKLLAAILKNPEGILQKRIIQETGLDSGSVSSLKQDLLQLGWIKEVELGGSKEVMVRPRWKRSLKEALGQWEFLQKAVLVRPHNIVCRGFFRDGPTTEQKRRLMTHLSRVYEWSDSPMNNNKQYVVELKGGKFLFNKQGQTVMLHILGIIIPIQESDLPIFQDLITSAIMTNVERAQDEVTNACDACNIKFSHAWRIPAIDLGVLVKTDVYKTLQLCEAFKESSIFVDESVKGCREIETRASIEQATTTIENVLREIFQHNQV